MLNHGGPPLRRLSPGVAACPPPPQEEEEVSRPAGPSPCPHLPGRGRAVLERSGARGRRVLRLTGGAIPGGAIPGGSIRAGHGREEEREVTAGSRDKPFPPCEGTPAAAGRPGGAGSAGPPTQVRARIAPEGRRAAAAERDGRCRGRQQRCRSAGAPPRSRWSGPRCLAARGRERTRRPRGPRPGWPAAGGRSGPG